MIVNSKYNLATTLSIFIMAANLSLNNVSAVDTVFVVIDCFVIQGVFYIPASVKDQ